MLRFKRKGSSLKDKNIIEKDELKTCDSKNMNGNSTKKVNDKTFSEIDKDYDKYLESRFRTRVGNEYVGPLN